MNECQEDEEEIEEENDAECKCISCLCIPGLHYQSCKAFVQPIARENLNDTDFMTDLDIELLGDDIGGDPYNPQREQGYQMFGVAAREEE